MKIRSSRVRITFVDPLPAPPPPTLNPSLPFFLHKPKNNEEYLERSHRMRYDFLMFCCTYFKWRNKLTPNTTTETNTRRKKNVVAVSMPLGREEKQKRVWICWIIPNFLVWWHYFYCTHLQYRQSMGWTSSWSQCRACFLQNGSNGRGISNSRPHCIYCQLP